MLNMLSELSLTTRDGKAIPVMKQEEALARGLIHGRGRRNTKPLYDLELTLPYFLSSESDMLISACNNLAHGNRRYLVVYNHTHAKIYISTSVRALPQLSPEDKTTIEGFFQTADDSAQLGEAS